MTFIHVVAGAADRSWRALTFDKDIIAHVHRPSKGTRGQEAKDSSLCTSLVGAQQYMIVLQAGIP